MSKLQSQAYEKVTRTLCNYEFRKRRHTGTFSEHYTLVPQWLPAKISPELLDILQNNFFSNATNHNTLGGSIAIQLTKEKLVIKNEGYYEPLDEKSHLSDFTTRHQNDRSLSIID